MNTSRAVGVIAAAYLLAVAAVGGVATVTDSGAHSVDVNPRVDAPTLVTQAGQPNGSVKLLDEQGHTVWSEGRWNAVFGADRGPNGTWLLATQRILQSSRACAPYDPPCANNSVVLYRPPADSVRVVWSYRSPKVKHNEIHDAEYADGVVTVAEMTNERVLRVAMNGTVLYEWNASSYYEAPPRPAYRDWLHINDVDELPDGRLMVDVRNSNQILFVRPGEGVVDVINPDTDDSDDGDCRGVATEQLYGEAIRCGDPSVIDHQHDPQWLGEGRVLIADSENQRIVELQRQNGSWERVWSVHGAGGTELWWPRDANRLANGHTLIVDTRNDRVVEVNKQGKRYWQAPAPDEPYAALRNGTEYPAGPSLDGETGAHIEQPIAAVTLLHGSLGYLGVAPRWFSEWLTLGGVVVVLVALIAGVNEGVAAVQRRLSRQ